MGAVVSLVSFGCAPAPRSPAAIPASVEATKEPLPDPPPKPVCLVLSVGAEQGLSHIGVIEALKEKDVVLDCVVGTSMGALVGALHAHSPQRDLQESYREIFRRYERRAKSDAGARGAFLGLLSVGATVASGGGALAILGTGAGGALLGASSVKKVEWDRLHEVLRESWGERTIESLPLRFVTSHQLLEGTGPKSVVVSGGDLSLEVAQSIANPLLFEDIEPTSGSRIDPGLDRVAAVPVEMACSLFPHHQLLVSNVTGDEVYVSKGMLCPYQEVKMSALSVDPILALQGREGFEELVASGKEASLAQVDWETLPTLTRPAMEQGDGAPLFDVDVTMVVEATHRAPSGEEWDLLDDPDIAHRTVIRACAGCDGFQTSASRVYRGQKTDEKRAEYKLGRMSLRPGFSLEIELTEIDDVSANDPMGALTLTFEGPGTEARGQTEGARVDVYFRPFDPAAAPPAEPIGTALPPH